MTDRATFTRINVVMSEYNSLYDAREPNSTVRRKLDTHEALFLSAVNCIRRDFNDQRRNAEKVWGGETQAYAALENLSYREEASKLEAALASFKADCETLECGADEAEQAVALAMAAE